MAADKMGEEQDAIYPLPKFYFRVTVPSMAGSAMAFQSADGLSVETNITEYRHSTSPNFHKIKMPGLKTYANLTLKRGVFKGDLATFTAFTKIKLNTVKRETVIIELLDETGSAAMTWSLDRAFVVKYTAPDLSSMDDGDPAIEEMEIAYESFSIS